MSKTTILIVEDDAGLREALLDTLLLGNYEVVAADCAEEALMVLSSRPVDLVVSDIQMGEMSGLTLLKSIKAKYPNMPVLLMTAYATIDDAVQAMRDGATDYLSKPFAPEVLLNLVGRYAPAQKIESRTPIVADPSSLKLLELSRKVAKSDATVMVMGPSGSGKEVLSRYIHDQSPRSDAPFIAINCAAIPENMLEREVERLGGRKTVKLNVRVIATSNRDLRKAVDAGEFREDLYYRLNVFPIEWRPLSERPGDIVPLAEHLVQRHASSQGLGTIRLSAAARNKLSQYSWPGNVRELENVVQRALILCEHNEIDASDLMIDEDMTAPVETLQEHVEENRLGSELRYQEHQIILDTLVSCNGKRKDVAEKLGISPRTLRYKLARMREDGIEVPA